MRFLIWIGENFVALLAFGLGIWAAAAHEYPTAQFFLLMAVLSGIGNGVGDIQRRLRALDATARPRPSEAAGHTTTTNEEKRP